MPKSSSKRVAKIAAKVMAGKEYTDKEVRALAASVLVQAERDAEALQSAVDGAKQAVVQGT